MSERQRRRPSPFLLLAAALGVSLGGAAPSRAHFRTPLSPALDAALLGQGTAPFHILPPALAASPSGALPEVTPFAVSDTAWLTSGLELQAKKRYRLAPAPTLAWIGRYLRPWENHTPEWRAYREGAYGLLPAPTLSWRLTAAPEPAPLPVLVTRPCPRWQAPRALTVVRYGGESEHLALFDCDGGIAPDVIDRLSILSRAPGTPRPELPLPDAPEIGRGGEWLPGIHLLDPRLVWALGKLGERFPGHRVVIMSGYRPDAHTSLHRRGRAIDLYVEGVDNAVLYRECRTLRDAGCGYYPHNVFVHLDVRPYGTRRVGWVDDSLPGEPSRYLDGWDGVLAPGEAWLGGG